MVFGFALLVEVVGFALAHAPSFSAHLGPFLHKRAFLSSDSVACSLCDSKRYAMCSPSRGSSKEKADFESEAEQPGSSSHGAAKTVKRRMSSKMRARIDIDDEIQEAAQISDMLKKVQKRAKSMQKSSKKAKQRLVSKASKLRAEDLERIAVLKRCGLFVHDNSAGPNGTVPDAGASQVTTETTRGKVQRAMAGIMSQTEGSAGLLHVFQNQHGSDTSGAQCESPIAGSVVHVPAPIPTGSRLGNWQTNLSLKHVVESQEVIEQAEDMAISQNLD
jgi:hypothetical protein